MILLSAEEAAVLELLDPGTARRLVIGRTGRAFVWDPLASTTEVSAAAARTLVVQGVVDTRGRIALEHIGLWRPGKAPARTGAADRFERTLPIAHSNEALRAMG